MSRKKVLISVFAFTIVIIALIIVFNPSHKYKMLSINENKWNSIIENCSENKNLILEDIKFNDYRLIVDEKNNTLYYSLVNDSSEKYNPDISYNCNEKNVKLAILQDEISNEKVKNNYIFKVMIYTETDYHIYDLKCTDLPILNISYNKAEEINNNNVSMEMYLFDNLSSMPNKITISKGKIKFEEGKYIMSLHMLTPGKNKRDNKISILNMKPNSEYVLMNANGNNYEKSVKGNRVELFLNSEYIGVYSIR